MHRSRLAIAAMFFVNGTLFATWASRIPGVKESLGLDDGQLGLALFSLALGTFVGLPVASWLIARFGSRGVTSVASLVCCILVPLVGQASSLLALSVILTLMGASMGTMDAAMNAQAAALERAFGRSIMASFHGLWSLGGLSGASLGGAFAAHAISPAVHFTVVAGALALLALLAMPRLMVDGSAGGARLAWPSRAVLGVGWVAACGSVIEGGVADWGGVYLRDSLGAGEGFAVSAFAAFSLAMTIGRLTADRLIDRIGPVRLLRAGAVLTALALAGVLLAQQPAVAVAGFALAGLGSSTVFPIAFTAAGNVPGQVPSTAIAAVATMGYGGGLAAPPFIGFVAVATSLPVALAVLVPMALFIAILARNLARPC